MNDMTENWNELKGMDLDNRPVSLWVLHRRLSEKKADYTPFKVEAEEKLRRKLREVTLQMLNGARENRPYFYGGGDQESVAYELPTGMTDFRRIREILESGARIESPKLSDSVVQETARVR